MVLIKSDSSGSNESKKGKRPRIKAILLCIAVLMVIMGGVAAVWQRNNLKAAQLYMTSSPEEIESKLSANEEKITESIKEMLPVPIKDLTKEEKQMLAAEELTKEEAVERILSRATTLAKDKAQNIEDGAAGNEAVAVTNEGSAEKNAEGGTKEGAGYSEVAGLAAEVYVLRAEFINRIESLKQSAASEYNALSAEARTASKKTELGMKYMQMAGQLEAECDRQMDNIISRIKAEVKLGNIDSSFVQEIQSAYAEEKSLQKAYYLSLYNNK